MKQVLPQIKSLILLFQNYNTMKLKYISIGFLLLLSLQNFAQSKTKDKTNKKPSTSQTNNNVEQVKEVTPIIYTDRINWMSFQEALKKSAIDNKPILMDMYTDWCGYCKRMDATTFKDSALIAYVNEHFYAVKFDAETIDKITYRDSVYTNSSYIPGQKKTAHDLAAKLTGNHLVYPTLIFIVEDKKIIAPVPGFQTIETIQPVMYYFGEKVYNLTNLWEAFVKGYTVPKPSN
jgi:thioredoxin-related protein